MPVVLRHRCLRRTAITVILLTVGCTVAHSQESAERLAKELANPIAALISVPFQGNFDDDLGPLEDGSRFTLNIQPVIPVSLNERWNLISRAILPVIDQRDIVPGGGSQTGLGDTLVSLFFSPKEPTSRGWVWGAGPALLLPTATDNLLGGEKWGAGPTVVVLRQAGPWTYGGLFNHVWSLAGDDDRPDISSTFLQPFLSYTTPSASTFSASIESTYDWKGKEWSVPLGLYIAQVLPIGTQLVSLQAGPRYYLDHRDNGPRGWGFRVAFTLLFPKKPAAASHQE